jgi:hypothetical protein
MGYLKGSLIELKDNVVFFNSGEAFIYKKSLTNTLVTVFSSIISVNIILNIFESN